MTPLRSMIPLTLGLLAAGSVWAGDWPQWRGPQRNGQSLRSAMLIEGFGKDGPKRLWQSENVPGHWGGGWGSLSVSKQRVFVFANPVTPDPKAGYHLTEDFLQITGWDSDPFPEELDKLVRKTALSEELNKLDRGDRREFVKSWLDKNLKRRWRRHTKAIEWRLRRGKGILSNEQYRKIGTLVGKVFKDAKAAQDHINGMGFSEDFATELGRGINAVKQNSTDRVVCLDANTGKVVWEKSFPGMPSNFRCSSTPTIAQGRCFVLGSGGKAYCLDAQNGSLIWQVKTKANPTKTVSSSFLVAGDQVIVIAGALMSFDIKTGKPRWEQGKAKGIYSSPVLWEDAGRRLVIAHDRNEVLAVDLATGEVVWTAKGAGGMSTPAIAGKSMVLVGRSRREGLTHFRLSAKGAKQTWTVPFADRGSSAVIHDGYAYALGDSKAGKSRALCVRLSDGKIMWDESVAKCSFSSPVVVGDKLLMIASGDLLMLKADPSQFKVVGYAKVKATPCTSPTIADGRLFIRINKGVACYELRAAY